MSYLIAMALFGLFTWGSNTYTAAPAHLKDSTAIKINRADTRFQYISLTLLILTAIISWGRR
jgi:nicotinamide riboside transporter PnuC